MPYLELKNVCLSFGDAVLLNNINFSVEQGETVVIAGPSGTGKSVILRMCIGLIVPTSGSILVDGEDICRMSERELNGFRKNFGMLFQNYGLFDSMTVAENVGFLLNEHYKLSKHEIDHKVRKALSQVNLENVEHLKPVELSGGMKKRVGIARAIVHNPTIVFLDEPVAGLDPVTSDVINDLILDMKAQYKMTSLAVSNNMSCAAKIGERIGILYDGTFVDIDSPDKILKSNNPVIHQFVNGLEEGPIKVI